MSEKRGEFGKTWPLRDLLQRNDFTASVEFKGRDKTGAVFQGTITSPDGSYVFERMIHAAHGVFPVTREGFLRSIAKDVIMYEVSENLPDWAFLEEMDPEEPETEAKFEKVELMAHELADLLGPDLYVTFLQLGEDILMGS